MGARITCPRYTEKMMAEKKEKRIVNLKYLKDKESEKAEGIFHFHERKEGTLKFHCRYHDGAIESYELVDGHKYTLPLYVIDHLNKNSGRYRVHALKKNDDNSVSKTVGKTVARYSFESTGFLAREHYRNPDELTPEIIVGKE